MPLLPRPLLCLVWVLLSRQLIRSHAEEQIKWTPNEQDDSGPLPLSMKQRQQLLQLEQAIAGSPDPQSTLEQVAQANQMDPQELVNMLRRNRADLQQGGGGPGMAGGRRRNVLVQLLSSIAVALMQMARKHPQTFGLLSLSVFLALYVSWSVPRSGLCLSAGPRKFGWTKGATCVWEPPAGFVQRQFLERDGLWSGRSKSGATHIEEVQSIWAHLGDSQTEYQWLDRKALQQASVTDIQHAAAGQITLRLAELFDADAGDQSLVDHLSLDHARELLDERQLTEFSEKVRCYSQLQRGVLVVPGMGDWGRVGLLPVYVAKQISDHASSLLVLTTHPGYHWEGEIHISVALESDDRLALRVTLVIPRKKRPVSKAVAEAVVSSLLASLSKSVTTRTRQSLSRSRQSSEFRRKARERAGERRHARLRKERELEEMAEDRRRRWQRRNPNAGHYRPSGDRMKSPNNAIYR